MQVKETPVYLFTGFLDSGKTTFIQQTLEDPGFNDGQKTLLLVSEEGETEYNPIKFASTAVKIVTVEDEDELTVDYLRRLQSETKAVKVIVEYNGMWSLDKFYNAMPENWVVYQEMTFLNSSEILTFNVNMRSLVYDKIKSAESVIFKNFRGGMDKMPYHKLVRTINRRCDIIYEYGPDRVEQDNIEDPLPFDINAPTIVIEDRDYAFWYADITENEKNYYGKTVRLKARMLTGGGLKDDEFVFGRHIMSCCEADIQFAGLVAKWNDAKSLKHGGWAVTEAKIVREYNDMYKSVGPVFHAVSVTPCEPPEEEVATFY